MKRLFLLLTLAGCLAAGAGCKTENDILAEDWVRARVRTEGDCLHLVVSGRTYAVVQTDGVDVRPGSRWHSAGRRVWVRLGNPQGRVGDAPCAQTTHTQTRLLEIKER